MNKTNEKRYYYPNDLVYYHPNMKGSGSAAQFELKPATRGRDGCFFLVMASQKTVTGKEPSGRRRMATFAWDEALTVKLGLSDIAQMLLVLQNKQPSIADGKGLFHDTADSNTIIQLQKADKHPGYILDVSRKAKRNGSEAVRLRIALTQAEALTLQMVFEQSTIQLVYGIPRIMPPAHSANSTR